LVVADPSGLDANFSGFKDKSVWFEQWRDFAGLNSQSQAPKPQDSA
jgi:hypothetical protein